METIIVGGGVDVDVLEEDGTIAMIDKMNSVSNVDDILENLDWQVILWSLVAILEVVVRLTPSEKDNSILNKVVWVLGKLVPNKKKDGKTF